MRPSPLALCASALLLCSAPLFAQRAARPRPSVAPPAPDRVLVPAGPFTMGADAGGEQDEHPAHQVTLPAFLIDRTELSRENYNRCVRAGVCEEPMVPERFRDPRQPVVLVDWQMARTYCHWAGGRLPTESEFEKAARGTDARTYAWGNDPPTPERAVFGEHHTTGHPDPVGSHPAGASPYGALDMAGNVWEWTETVYDPYAYTRPTETPTCASALAAFADLRHRNLWSFTGANGIPEECERVLRGGAWNYWPGGLRASNRVHHPPTFRGAVSGFRCAADAPASGS